jgi:hypothetical protein
MRRIGMLGVFALAAAVLAVIAGSASATPSPEFGRCVAQAGGKYANSGCTKVEAGKEKFEWHSGVVKNHFTGKLKEGIPTLETVGKTKITCKTEENPGEINTPKSVAGVVAKFTGCETSGLPCKSAGAAEGEIVTSSLEGVLGVEKIAIVEGKEVPAKNKLAVELHAPAGQNIAEFSCAGLPVVVRGSVLHPVVAGKMLLSSTEKFVAKAGEQKPDKFAGEPVDAHILESNTNGGPFEEAGQTITVLSTAEEKLEANPVV